MNQQSQINMVNVSIQKLSKIRLTISLLAILFAIAEALIGLSFLYEGMLMKGSFCILVGISVFKSVLPKENVACPLCKHEKKVISNSKNFKCSKCHNLIVLNWDN